MNLDALLAQAVFLTPPVVQALGSVYGLLIALTLIFYFASITIGKTKLIEELITRTRSWWIILVGFTLTIFINREVATIAIAFLAFTAFRELTSRLEWRAADRRALFWCYIAIPFQFMAAYVEWYGFFIIFIPVIMFVFLSARTVAAGETKGITNSLGVIHWATMLTIFSMSHLAYLLALPPLEGFSAGNGGMLLWLVLITELNDVFQFAWGKTLGKHKIIPSVSPNKTVEGFFGGLLTTTGLGWFLSFLLPVSPEKATILAAMLAFTGFLGDVTISAIKRDLGIKDMGNSIPGHGGVMDRIDSLAFNAFVFFHFVRYWSYL